jgi:membrane protease YdiL (CAAX protease family)
MDDPRPIATFTTMDPQHKRIGTFLLLTFAISWSIAGIGIALGVTPTMQLGYMAMAVSFMFGPAIAAIIQHRLIDRAPWSGLGLGFRDVRWGQVAWTAVIGLALIPVALLVAWALGDGLGIEAFGHVSITQERMLIAMEQAMKASGMDGQVMSGPLKDVRLPGIVLLLVLLGGALLSACTVNLPAMMGEELGWRGYLYQATAHWSGLRRVVFTGVVWGLWHAPLIALGHNYPGHPVAGIALMVVFCVLLSVPFDRARQRSGSVWSVALLHGCINGSAGAYMLFAWDGAELVNSPVGLAGFIALALLSVLVFVVDPVYRSTFLRAGPPAPVPMDQVA